MGTVVEVQMVRGNRPGGGELLTGPAALGIGSGTFNKRKEGIESGEKRNIEEEYAKIVVRVLEGRRE